MSIVVLLGGLTMSFGLSEPGDDRSPADTFQVRVVGPTKPVRADEATFEVVVSTDLGEPQKFSYTDFPLTFGAYVLGPWGAVEPTPNGDRPRRWITMEHSSAKIVKIAKGQPFRVVLKLSDYYPTADREAFRPGDYQVNVKFYSASLKMERPTDSGPVAFKIVAADPK